MHMYSHILIPTDGSEFARKGVDHGLSLAKTLGSKVTVLIVTEPYPFQATASDFAWVPSEEDIASYDRQQGEYAAKALEPVKAQAAKIGVPIETLHEADDFPSIAIGRVATEHGCDLIVMATHGRRGLQRLFLGSQTLGVLQHSTVPVLVVR